MKKRSLGGNPAPRGADQKSLAQQVGLVGILNGRGLFAARVRQGGETHGLVRELLAEQAQDAPVNLVQSSFVDAEEFQRLNGDCGTDHRVILHGGKVTHAP